MEKMLREKLLICKQFYGYQERALQKLFALRMLMKYLEGEKELHCVFVDQEKT